MKKLLYFFVVIAGVFFLSGNCQVEAATKLQVKVGNTVSVKKQNASYKSSDKDVAYVDENGIIYGKKVGNATITIKSGTKQSKVTVEVKANKKKPNFYVCVGEIVVDSPEIDIQEKEDGGYTYTASVCIKNRGEKKVSKVELYAGIGREEVVFECRNIGPGEDKIAELSGEIDDSQEEVKYNKVYVYSNKMVQRYSYVSKRITYDYATEDTTAPVITGFVGENSYNDNVTYRVIYSDDKNFDYFKYVKATDDRDTKVKLTVDTNKVNFKKNGTYTITYIAEDKAGNVTKKKAKIGVRVVSELDKMCSSILKSITKENWSDTQKARAIYKYVRGHMHYTGYSDKSNWEKEAVNGIRYQRGDCFTYYATCRALLTRAGIPNIEVTRVKGHGAHWWSLVYVQGGFYHFDTTPRTAGGNFCLVTDEQLKAYSSKYGNSHIWAYDKKPKSPKKKISSIF